MRQPGLALELALEERETVDGCMRQTEFLDAEIAAVERLIAQDALGSPQIRRLMSVPGVNVIVAASFLAAIGDIGRFESPRKLVGYLGLDPRVRQSGNEPAKGGRISKRGSSSARWVLVEAAWSVIQQPGPLRAFFQRVSTRRGPHIAAVAVARKLTGIIWHLLTRGEDYAWVRPALHAKKLRDLELRSGEPARRGQRGAAYAYNLTRTRQEERRRVEQAETAYRRMTEGWSRRSQRVPTGAAKEERL